MSAFPAAEGAVESFTPSCLAHMPTPPVFLLRPAGERELPAYRYALAEEGLHYPSDASIREEILRGVGRLYSAEQAADAETRLLAFWQLIDKGGATDPAESAAVSDLVNRLTQAWSPLARGAAARIRFVEESAAVAVSMFLVGWSGVEIPYYRELGRTPLPLVDQLQDYLFGLEQLTPGEGGGPAPAPGMAFLELCNAATRRLDLAKAPAPPPAPPARRRRPRRASVKPQRPPAQAKGR